jgi:hypothetical protein
MTKLPEGGLHVILLTADHQATLWGLLYNAHAMMMLDQMGKAVATVRDQAGLERRHQIVMAHLDSCMEIMNLFGEDSKGRRQARTFFFSPTGMSRLLEAITIFSPDKHSLAPDDAQLVRHNISGLKELVEKSSGFLYSREELRKAGLQV